jgi:hypothetical protein
MAHRRREHLLSCAPWRGIAERPAGQHVDVCADSDISVSTRDFLMPATRREPTNLM